MSLITFVSRLFKGMVIYCTGSTFSHMTKKRSPIDPQHVYVLIYMYVCVRVCIHAHMLPIDFSCLRGSTDISAQIISVCLSVCMNISAHHVCMYFSHHNIPLAFVGPYNPRKDCSSLLFLHSHGKNPARYEFAKSTTQPNSRKHACIWIIHRAHLLSA
jgi:hypothetical protein